jgi:photolyase PhrII
MSEKQTPDRPLAPSAVLPTHLAERVVVRRDAPPAPGAFVLYWARTALRGHENPALDTALVLARALDRPVLVYQGLTERYPYASDRHHVFILEGARDFHRDLAARGVASALHVERDGHRGPHLHALAARAAAVVTECMPVAPLAQWTLALARDATAPVWEVDTACVAPMPLVRGVHDRAGPFRRATATLVRERVARPWHDEPAVHAPARVALPFAPVDPATMDIAALVAACRIDHGVAPVAHTRGGSDAGLARWRAFVRAGGLARYAGARNDPLRDGTSRLSPWLHYGMVSPLRVAREARAHGGASATRWLDELLTWRELAYHWCLHHPGHDTLDALPPWAQATLAEHADDPRAVIDHETLSRGLTGDAYWDAMQRSLRIHGTLHNNARMAWGKAIPGWTRSPAAALAMLLDLNDRHALDGRDPASRGGLLWCLGLFDRPFPRAVPVLGTVRARPTAEVARRTDVPRYAAMVARPALPDAPRVAVIGGGLAGLLCARTLADHALDVTVLERATRVGGRCATREHGPRRWDHGAQYFTVRDARLRPLLHAWRRRGLVAEWRAPIGVHEDGAWRASEGSVRRWVGVPGMRALAAHLAADLAVRTDTTVASLARDGDGWRLHDADGRDVGRFDAVIVALPAPAAARLLRPHAPALAERADAATMHPCWATLVAFDGAVALPYDGAFVNGDAVLAWVARDGSKPGRPEPHTWVLHATRAWSAARLDADRESVREELLAAFARLAGGALPPVLEATAHRWSQAIPDPALAEDALYDATLALGACGDWCGGPRIEGALLGGLAAAGRLLVAAHVAAAGTVTRAPGEPDAPPDLGPLFGDTVADTDADASIDSVVPPAAP